jgi:uncharacterized protein (TIGR02145 family)
MKKSAIKTVVLLILAIPVLFLTSCQTEDDILTTINSEITSEYLLSGDLDVYLQNEQVFRHKGKPGVETISIGNGNLSDFEDCFILYVASGTGSIGAVSSAIISLDGQQILNTSSFSNSEVTYSFEVCNLSVQSVLEIEVRGEPGSYIDIWMEGKTNDLFSGNSGTFIDERDGQEYKWVKIGDQIWMAENLNVGKRIDIITPQTDNNIIEKYAYNDDESYCDIYGGLYQWNEVMNYSASSASNPSGVQGICPNGWHVPSDEEWSYLAEFINEDNGGIYIPDYYLEGDWSAIGNHLKSTSGWFYSDGNGTDDYGFTAIPAGYAWNGDGSSYYSGRYGYWWSSTEFDSNRSHYRYIGSEWDGFWRTKSYKTDTYSIRCVKD